MIFTRRRVIFIQRRMIFIQRCSNSANVEWFLFNAVQI